MKKVVGNSPFKALGAACHVDDTLHLLAESDCKEIDAKVIADMECVISTLDEYCDILSVDKLKSFIDLNKEKYWGSDHPGQALPIPIISYKKLVDFIMKDNIDIDIDDKLEERRHPYINRTEFKRNIDNLLFTGLNIYRKHDDDDIYIDVYHLVVNIIDKNTIGITDQKGARLMEFKQSGLLWFINTILHVFGWAIVYNIDDKSGNVIDLDIRKVPYRGFGEKSNDLGYTKLSDYMRDNGPSLYYQAFKGLNPEEQKEFLKTRYYNDDYDKEIGSDGNDKS